MANIKISGRTATIVSVYTLADIEKLGKYRPEALVLEDKDGNVTFKVGTSCCGSISDYGVGFADETFGNGKACVTVLGGDAYATAEEFVLEEIGTAINKLNKVESQIAGALDEVEAEITAIKDAIEIA